MAIDKLATQLGAKLYESQNQRDARVEELWKELNPQSKDELDLKGLQKGLRRIDHPLKNATYMLKGLLDVVDTNKDGKIQYEEFRKFIQETEQQLWILFHAIDRDRNGKLEKKELQAAFLNAGLCVPMRRLTAFFDEIDLNDDGYISFEEWRDFLLFMPAHGHMSPLHAALSYYSSIVTLNAEGDSMVSEETLEGIGTTSGFLMQALFGSILQIGKPPQATLRQSSRPASKPNENSNSEPPSGNLPSRDHQILHTNHQVSLSKANSKQTRDLSWTNSQPQQQNPQQTLWQCLRSIMYTIRHKLGTNETEIPDPAASHMLFGELENFQDLSFSTIHGVVPRSIFSRLTEFLPEPGYFAAGALAGGISRTVTAPLDRLKVYLLVNTHNHGALAVSATKKGQPLYAIKHLGKPVMNAVKDLWTQGGFRTFFAGNGLNVIKIMPETAIKFGAYEAAKRTLAKMEGHNDPNAINSYSKFAAGGVAGMIAQFCVYPLDTLKFRLQCETVKGGPSGSALLVNTAKNMYMNGGIQACYRGIAMGLVGMFPYSAIDMGTFEFLKKSFKTYKARHTGVHEEDVKVGNVVTGIIGATSGAFGATVVYPLNVLRTRLQTQGTKMHPPKYAGIWDVTIKTFRNEGIRGMYKGLTPNLAKVAPALSITWVVYEKSKKLLNLE